MSYIILQIYKLLTITVLSSLVAIMKFTMVYLCWRLLSLISWFTDLCFKTCWRVLRTSTVQVPQNFYPVIFRGNCAASYKITLTSTEKWQREGGQSLTSSHLSEYVLKVWLLFLFVFIFLMNPHRPFEYNKDFKNYNFPAPHYGDASVKCMHLGQDKWNDHKWMPPVSG